MTIISQRLHWLVLIAFAILSGPAEGDQRLSKTYLVVTDRTTGSAVRFEPADGAFKDFLYTQQLGAEAITFGPDQNLYVTLGSVSGTVRRYNGATGMYIDEFVRASTSKLTHGQGLTFGPDGNLYVADPKQNAVLRYDGATGAYLSHFVPASSGKLKNPAGLTFGPDGHLYVTSGTPFQSNPNAVLDPQIVRFDGKTGAFKDVFVQTRSGGLEAPWTCIFGPDGNLYVSAVTRNAVLRYNGKNGTFIDEFVKPGSGGIKYPTGMAFGPDGHFYVNSSILPTIGILRYDGQTGDFKNVFVAANDDYLRGPTGVLFYDFETQITPAGIDPAIAADASGNRLVAWVDGTAVKARVFDPNGVAKGNVITIPGSTTSGELPRRPRVVATSAGFLMAWHAGGGSALRGPRIDGASSARIFIITVPPSGTPVTTQPKPVNSETPPADANDHDVALTPTTNGSVVAVWSRDTGGSTTIVGRVLDPVGNVQGGEKTLVTNGGKPAIAPTTDGVLVAWRGSGATPAIVAQSFGQSLSPVSSAFTVSGTGTSVVGEAALAGSGSRILASWSATDTSSNSLKTDGASNARIFYVPVTPSGPTTTPAPINLDPNRPATSPTVSVSPSGEAAVVWQYGGSGGSGGGVYGRTVSPSGQLSGSEFVVSDSATSSEGYVAPAAVVTPNGATTVVSAKQDGQASGGIFTRVKEAAAATCSASNTTACVLNSRFRVTVRYRGGFDNGAADTDALVRSVTGFASAAFETVFFYFNSENNIEMMVKILDQGNTDSTGKPTIAVLFGSATPLRVELAITDTVKGGTKVYSSEFNRMKGGSDFTAFVK